MGLSCSKGKLMLTIDDLRILFNSDDMSVKMQFMQDVKKYSKHDREIIKTCIKEKKSSSDPQ